MQFARINDVTLHFDAAGMVPGRPVLVFVNSLGTDQRIWDEVRAVLPAGWASLVYDKRGHGLSDLGATPYSIDDHVADLAGLMDHLGIARAVICGVSVGGLIAQGFCRRHPERVAGLLLSNTALKIGDDSSWNARIAAVETGGIAPLADGILERWFSPAYRVPDNAAFAAYTNMLTRQPAAGYAATCAAIRDADFATTTPAIAVPTLCVAGDSDLSTPPALVETLAAAIPGAQYQLIAGAGHLPMIEQPAAFSALLAAFLSNLPGGGK